MSSNRDYDRYNSTLNLEHVKRQDSVPKTFKINSFQKSALKT